MIFVRPCRSATIRTRLDAETVRERLSALAGEGSPEGWDRFMSHGYFLNGRVDVKELHIDYHYNAHRNPQTYAVHGRVQDTRDWRVLRLKMTAHAPWLSWIEMSVLALVMGFYVVTGEAPPAPAIGVCIFVTAVYAFANLMFIPDRVRERVAAMLATQVSGSVQVGGQWVVPQ